MRRVLLAAALAAFVTLPALAQEAVPVGTIIAAKQSVSNALTYVGRVQAINSVSVRARVTGYLDAVLFTEGDPVKEGDRLFQIDPAPFAAAVQQAQGQLLQAQGDYANASLQSQRAEELVRTNVTSVAERDRRVAEQQHAQGAVIIADANLKTAEINLGYATITAPVSGRVGRAQVTKGNLVGPDTGQLTLIVSQDPMYVLFPVSQTEFLRIRAQGQNVNRGNVSVRLHFADGSAYDQTGKVNFIDVAVDPSTDTVLVRAEFPNPNGILVDKQFVTVSVVSDTPDEKVVIPQAALLADQEGVYVFVVQDGKAAIRRVKPGVEVGAGIAIDSGLAAGDQVVVNGTQTLRPGAAVTASPIPASMTTGPARPEG
jgi:membrane fusion protein (multidrug efflux system)